MADTLDLSSYDVFYENGGWRYGFVREWLWHRRHLVRRFGLRRGRRMIEVACGIGFHTNLYCRMGFECVGFDANETAVRIARERYPRRTFQVADARGDLPFEANTWDVVITRGCSLYHYDLALPRTHETTANLLRYLRPGGLFVLIIATDLSGRRDAGRIWQNTLEDYQQHFAAHGSNASVDWHKGMVICGLRKEAVPAGT